MLMRDQIELLMAANAELRAEVRRLEAILQEELEKCDPVERDRMLWRFKKVEQLRKKT